MKEHVCWGPGCRALVRAELVFCPRCAALLHDDTRKLIERGFRPNRRQSEVFGVHLHRAMTEIAYAKTEGHRIPREAEFEW